MGVMENLTVGMEQAMMRGGALMLWKLRRGGWWEWSCRWALGGVTWKNWDRKL